MRISEIEIGEVYLIEMPTGYISDHLVMSKTVDGDYVKLFDLDKRQSEWYRQDDLAGAKILGKVVWQRKVFEIYKWLVGDKDGSD